MLDARGGSVDPRRFHATNLVLHVANFVLLFVALRRMTGARFRSGLVAALFAVHPLHVDSVAWVAERKNVLGTLFWLLAMAAYQRYVERKGAFRCALALLALALGLAAKPGPERRGSRAPPPGGSMPIRRTRGREETWGSSFCVGGSWRKPRSSSNGPCAVTLRTGTSA